MGARQGKGQRGRGGGFHVTLFACMQMLINGNSYGLTAISINQTLKSASVARCLQEGKGSRKFFM
jgi:hypothetical protein